MSKKNIIIPSDIIGQKFNRLTIIRYVGKIDARTHRVIVKCDCGVEKEVTFNNLKTGRIKSCGCLIKEFNAKGSSRKHGLYKHPLFRTWHSMKRRCSGHIPNYNGVIICKEWLSDFMSFFNWANLNGWEEGLELDKDKLSPYKVGNEYCPKYCCFITSKENSQYRRNSIFIEYKGIIKSVSQWAEELGISSTLLGKRLRSGWDIIRAFETPIIFHQKIMYNGEEKMLSEWCRQYKIDSKVVSRRIHQLKWPFDKAISTDVRNKRRSKNNLKS